MMENLWNMLHGMGTHFYEIPTLIVFIILLVVIGVHCWKQKKREDEFEKKMDEQVAEISAAVGAAEVTETVPGTNQ